MGCWNETCGITQMPIFEDDPVRCVLLVHVHDNKENHSGFTESNQCWSPKFLPIQGLYDGYGSLKDIHMDWNINHIIEHLATSITAVKLYGLPKVLEDNDDLSDAPCEVTSMDVTSWTIYDVLQEVHRDKVWVMGTYRAIPVGMMFMHEWVWNHMSATYHDWRHVEPLSVDQILTHGHVYYEQILLSPSKDTKKSSSLPMKSAMPDGFDHKNAFYGFLYGSGQRLDPYGSGPAISEYAQIMWQMGFIKNVPLSDPLVQQILLDLSKFLCFRTNMRVLRKLWTPQAGAGSQDQDLEYHYALHKLAMEKCQDKIKEFDHL